MSIAICICSGGLDSSVAAAMAKNRGYRIHLLHFSYGQRAQLPEYRAASKIAKHLGAQLIRLKLDFMREFRSALIQPEIPLDSQVYRSVPATWVPARNAIFLSIAAGLAESLEADAIFVGFNAQEARSYPDNTLEFVSAFNWMLRWGAPTRSIQVIAPLVELEKPQIVELGLREQAPLELTWSCYLGDYYPLHCGECASCRNRKQGFSSAGIPDPAKYRR